MTPHRPNRYKDAIATVRARTAPTSSAVARVRGRLDLQLAPATDLLDVLPSPTANQVARVRGRLADSRQERVARPLWLLPVGGLALAGAAFAMAVSLPAPPTPVDLLLEGTGETPIGRNVVLTHTGEGEVTGTTDKVIVAWEAGALGVDTTGSHASVSVRTREGIARGIATTFAVERDALGTRVAVTDGTVALSCGGDSDLTLTADNEDAWCLPVTAAGWLARARALEDGGSPDADVLMAADEGLAFDADPAVRSELDVARMGALLRTGQMDEALAAAESAIHGAGPERAEELHRAAARLALAGGDCARALPHLDALVGPTPNESAHAEHCR